MNNIACIGKIVEISNVENSDFLAQATVVCGGFGKWIGVVKKDQLFLNDLVEVFLPDALLPEIPRFEFLKNRKYRIVQSRFRGAISEVLIMPLSEQTKTLEIGTPIGDILGIKKYEKPIDPRISGDVEGQFPSFIPKTDEPNYQGVQEMLDELHGKEFFATVKMDGSSGTFFNYNGRFGACTRNLEMKESEKSMPWMLANKYKLKEKLPVGMAIQFEMIGPKIQGNPMGLSDYDMYVFNAYDIDKRRYLDFHEFVKFCSFLGVPSSEVVYKGIFDKNCDLKEMAKGNYQNGKPREGIVIRPMIETIVKFQRLSFKVINLEYGK